MHQRMIPSIVTQRTKAIQAFFLAKKSFLSAYVLNGQSFSFFLGYLCDRFRVPPLYLLITLERDFHLVERKAAPRKNSLSHLFAEYFNTTSIDEALHLITQTYANLIQAHPDNPPQELLKKYFLKRVAFLNEHSFEQTQILYERYLHDSLL